MKTFVLALTLASLSIFNFSTAFADNNRIDPERTVLNNVKVINSTAKNIGYIIISASDNRDNLYAVKAKSTDTYHAKATGDVNATVKIAECLKINKVTGICSVYKKDSVKNCLNESRYDFYKVKSLKITALDTCSITCNDGTTDSCTVQ
jgi:hypothetical protein